MIGEMLLNTHDSKLVSCVNSNNIKNRKAEQEHQDREMIMWSVNENLLSPSKVEFWNGVWFLQTFETVKRFVELK